MGADPSIKNEPSSILPGHLTFVNTADGRKGFWPLYEVKPDLTGLVKDIEQITARIDRCFLVDVFMAISQMEGVQPRNTLEIAERKGEKLQRLGPGIGLWKTEFADTLIQRALRIMERRNLLRPLPKSLHGIPLKISYIDMVTLAQLGTETAGMERTFQIGGNLSAGAKAAGLPDPLRVVNLDKSFRIYAQKVNYPAAGLYTEDEVKAHDEERLKQIAQAHAMQATQAAVQGAQVLSKTDLGGGQNALGAMLGIGGQGGGAAPAGG